MHERWTIRLLGGLRAEDGTRVVSRFRTQQTGVLLAYLAYFRRSHPRELLAEVFWPESSPAAARHQLSNCLSSLRHQFEPPGVPPGAVIAADRFTVQLNPAAFTTDVAEFERCLAAAGQASSPAHRARLLIQAIEAYAPLLPGYYADWISSEQGRLTDRCLEAVREAVRLLEQSGDLPRAIDYCRRAVALDPLLEESHGELIRLLIAAGQTGAALRQYQELERLLWDELGSRPQRATRELILPLGLPPVPRNGAAAPRLQGAGSPSATEAGQNGTPAPPVPLLRGTVTFLVTEVDPPEAAEQPAQAPSPAALPAHLERAARKWAGHPVQRGAVTTIGFHSALNAALCLLEWVQHLGAVQEDRRPAVRMALFTEDVPSGCAVERAVPARAALLLAAAHPGQVLCSDSTAALLRREPEWSARLRELGLFRLGSGGDPERLFQVDPPGAPCPKFPPPLAQPAHRSNLPPQVTRFFGRENELARLRQMLAPAAAPGEGEPGTRLVTLMGPGGTGKTRLALEAAAGMLASYRGAAWLVPLHDLRDPGLLPGAILDALGHPRQPHTEPLEQVIRTLGEQPCLLVLDNFEQLVEGGGALVAALLERAPRLFLLVTSRRLLGVSGEQVFAVAPLSTPEGAGTPERLSACESVRLFVDRAQSVKPDFTITPGNAAVIAGICDRLEGMPLALELAAARVQVVAPAQILAQLADRFDFLVSRRRGLPERQRTLRAAVDWSYRLLSPEVRRFFTRLAVFRGGWTAEAAEAVCEEPLALDCLAELADCSMVSAEERDDHFRFRMLDTLREYAAGELDGEEKERLSRAHAEYFALLAERVNGEVLGPNAKRCLDLLDEELDNLRAAIAWAAGSETGGEWGLRLCGALSFFWRSRGHLREGQDLCARMLAHPTAATRDARTATALLSAGNVAGGLGQPVAHEEFARRALEIYHEAGDQHGESRALNALGNVLLVQGQRESAREAYERSLHLARVVGDRVLEAGLLNNLSNIAEGCGDFTAAAELLEAALVINRETGNHAWEAVNLSNLGNVRRHQGAYREARAAYEQALAIHQEVGNRTSAATALFCLGLLSFDEEDYDQALRALEALQQVRQELGAAEPDSALLCYLAKTAAETGRLQEAFDLGHQAVAAARKARMAPWEALSLGCLAEAYLLGGNADEAAAHFRGMGAIARELDKRPVLAECLEGVAITMPPTEAAARLWGAAANLRRRLGCPPRPAMRRRHARSQEACSAALGADRFSAAFAAGEALSLDQALDLALDAAPV